MAMDRDRYHRVSVAEAHTLPEPLFRSLFVCVAIEMRDDSGETFMKRIDFRGRRLEQLSTQEMREIVLRHQEWFNPRTQEVA
jgi:hypothetical protein